MIPTTHQTGGGDATGSRMGVVVALGLLAVLMCHGRARAQDISIPGFGDLTVFAVANFGVLASDGTLGTANDSDDDVQVQSVNSAVGIDWVWDIGYSHKILGHYEYGGAFSEIEDTIDDAGRFRSWIGFSNFLGTFTYGKQPTAFLTSYGRMIDRSQDFYATGYTTPNAGGLELADMLKFATSFGRFELDVDYQADALGSDSPVEERIGVGARYRQWLSRINIGGAFSHDNLVSGESVDRFASAIEYDAEQWSVALGGHLLSDDTSHNTKSLNFLTTIQLTPDNEFHLSLAMLEDDDVFDRMYGAGFYLDHKIGSQWRIYAEGAATAVGEIGGSGDQLNSQLLIGVRFDFGNVWY